MAHAMPKSVRTTRPPPHRCTLPGVTSRCTIPARCVAWSTSTRRSPTLVTWRTGSGPAAFRVCCSAGRAAAPSRSTGSLSLDDVVDPDGSGMVDSRAARASLRAHAQACARISADSRPCSRSCLTATGRSSSSSSASQTRPMPPRPKSDRSRKRPATRRSPGSPARRPASCSGTVGCPSSAVAHRCRVPLGLLPPSSKRAFIPANDGGHGGSCRHRQAPILATS